MSDKKTIIERWREWIPPKDPPENSIPFRISVFILVSIGILTASQYSSSLSSGLTAVGIMAVGFVVSWYRREKNNWHIKTVMAILLLTLLFRYLEELMGNPFDTRLTLANLLINLSALHSYDIPARRNLAYAIFIGIILMGVSATINREVFFAFPALLFILMLWIVWRLDSGSARGKAVINTRELREYLKVPARSVIITIIGFISIAVIVFLSLPHFDNQRMIQQMPVSIKMNFPKDYKKGIQELPQSANLPADEAKKQFQEKLSSGEAFYGFSSDMDLNYRGRLSDKIVMRVRSSRAAYWRGMAYDTYNMNKWVMSRPDDLTEISNTELPLRPTPKWDDPKAATLATSSLIHTFYIEEDMSNLVLMARYPYEIYFPTYQMDMDIYGGFRSPVGMVQGITYTVISAIPEYEPDKLNRVKSSIKPEHLGNYLQIPDNLKTKLHPLAQSIIASASTDYERASAIESYLQVNYAYNKDIPPVASGVDNVEYFLFTSKEGYCEHFASSMVLLCRSEGLPARIVTGFSPGKRNFLTHYYEVRWSDAHAWVEVYFDRYGWVPFEPTANWGMPREKAPSDNGKPLLASIFMKFVPKNINITFDNSPIIKFNKAVNKNLENLNNMILSRAILIIIWVGILAVISVLIYYIYNYLRSYLIKRELKRKYPGLSQSAQAGLEKLYNIHKKLKINTKGGLMPPEIVRLELEKRDNIRYNKKLYISGELETIKKLIYNENDN